MAGYLHNPKGYYKKAYSQLPFFYEKIKETNPGSVASFPTKEDSSFHFFFVSFHVAISGFQQGCRPLIFFDTVALNSKYQETLLASISADAGNGIFPVALDVVDAEDEENWLWVLQELKSVVSFVGDFQEGLKKEVPKVLENCYHNYCLRHLAEKLNRDLKGKCSHEARQFLINDFYAAAHTRKLEEIQCCGENIKGISLEAYDWVIQSEPEHWANAFFEGARYDHMTSTFRQEFYNNLFHEFIVSIPCAMEPEPFLYLLPSKLEAKDLSEENVCLFLILKQYTVGARLKFFTSEILSMLGWIIQNSDEETIASAGSMTPRSPLSNSGNGQIYLLLGWKGVFFDHNDIPQRVELVDIAGAFGRVFLAKKQTVEYLFAIKVLKKTYMICKNAVNLFDKAKVVLKKLPRPKSYVDGPYYGGAKTLADEINCDGTSSIASFYRHYEQTTLTVIGFQFTISFLTQNRVVLSYNYGPSEIAFIVGVLCYTSIVVSEPFYVYFHGEEIDGQMYLNGAKKLLKESERDRFLIGMEDSTEGIYVTLKECGVMDNSVGGIRVSTHHILVNGNYIRGMNETSNGIVLMLRVYNDATYYVTEAGGKMKDLFVVYLESWDLEFKMAQIVLLNDGSSSRLGMEALSTKKSLEYALNRQEGEATITFCDIDIILWFELDLSFTVTVDTVILEDKNHLKKRAMLQVKYVMRPLAWYCPWALIFVSGPC